MKWKNSGLGTEEKVSDMIPPVTELRDTAYVRLKAGMKRIVGNKLCEALFYGPGGMLLNSTSII